MVTCTILSFFVASTCRRLRIMGTSSIANKQSFVEQIALSTIDSQTVVCACTAIIRQRLSSFSTNACAGFNVCRLELSPSTINSVEPHTRCASRWVFFNKYTPTAGNNSRFIRMLFSKSSVPRRLKHVTIPKQNKLSWCPDRKHEISAKPAFLRHNTRIRRATAIPPRLQ